MDERFSQRPCKDVLLTLYKVLIFFDGWDVFSTSTKRRSIDGVYSNYFFFDGWDVFSTSTKRRSIDVV